MIQSYFTKCKDVFKATIDKLKGSGKRMVLAIAAEASGRGDQFIVAIEFQVSREDAIRKGRYELKRGIPFEDAFHKRGSSYII